jgi:hypothetical protein
MEFSGLFQMYIEMSRCYILMNARKPTDKFKKIQCHIGYYYVYATTKHKDANVMPN